MSDLLLQVPARSFREGRPHRVGETVCAGLEPSAVAGGDVASGERARVGLSAREKVIAAFLLAAVSFAPALVASDKETGLRALSGVWRLDTRVSEDPLRMLRRGHGNPPRRDGSKRHHGAEPKGPSLEQRAAELIAGTEVLTLAYRDEALTITYWDDRERVFRVDGRKVSDPGAQGRVEVRASWKGSDRLLVKTTGAPAGKVVEIFELGERRDKLFVTNELYVKGSKYPFSFDRVYHRVGRD